MGQFPFRYRFILLASFMGLVCYACSATLEMPAETNQSGSKGLDNDTQLAVSPIPAATNKPEPVPSSTAVSTTHSAAYREGINLASSAYHLSQSAVSPDDWGLIASRWQQAAGQLKKVSRADAQYEMAQQKITDYTRQSEHAAAQVTDLQRSFYRPRSPLSQASEASIQPRATAAPKTLSSSRSLHHVSVPIARRLHGTPVVRVTFNDTHSYDMILDTGASRTLITRQMASDLNIMATEQMLAATASESEVAFDIGQVRSIAMGAVVLADAQVGIGDSVSIGLLGNDFLRGYDVTIRQDVVELAVAD
ncbi:MAG: retropepsin-like aspartic protease [Phormidesmis sp.]